MNVVTIAAEEGVHNYMVLGLIKAKLGRFSLHSNKNLCAMTGCHGNMVTMATVNSDLSLYVKKELRLDVMNYLL